MAINEALVREVHATVRAYFKGRKKSANKIYDTSAANFADLKMTPAMQKKIAWRNMNAAKAWDNIKPLRESKAFDTGDMLSYGFEVLDQLEVAGNCVEMAAAAAYLVVRDKIGTAWFVGANAPADHAFCLVDDGADQHPETIGGHKGYSVSSSDGWVIDPWANVCCKMRDYDAQFAAKMRQWSAQGKRVRVFRPSDLAVSILDPADPDYLGNFRVGPLTYIAVGDKLPQSVPRALYRVLPDADRTVKKSGCCVIL